MRGIYLLPFFIVLFVFASCNKENTEVQEEDPIVEEDIFINNTDLTKEQIIQLITDRFESLEEKRVSNNGDNERTQEVSHSRNGGWQDFNGGHKDNIVLDDTHEDVFTISRQKHLGSRALRFRINTQNGERGYGIMYKKDSDGNVIPLTAGMVYGTGATETVEMFANGSQAYIHGNSNIYCGFTAFWPGTSVIGARRVSYQDDVVEYRLAFSKYVHCWQHYTVSDYANPSVYDNIDSKSYYPKYKGHDIAHRVANTDICLVGSYVMARHMVVKANSMFSLSKTDRGKNGLLLAETMMHINDQFELANYKTGSFSVADAHFAATGNALNKGDFSKHWNKQQGAETKNRYVDCNGDGYFQTQDEDCVSGLVRTSDRELAKNAMIDALRIGYPIIIPVAVDLNSPLDLPTDLDYFDPSATAQHVIVILGIDLSIQGESSSTVYFVDPWFEDIDNNIYNTTLDKILDQMAKNIAISYGIGHNQPNYQFTMIKGVDWM